VPLVKAVHFLEDLELKITPPLLSPAPSVENPAGGGKKASRGERAKASEAQARPLTAIPGRRIS